MNFQFLPSSAHSVFSSKLRTLVGKCLQNIYSIKLLEVYVPDASQMVHVFFFYSLICIDNKMRNWKLKPSTSMEE